MRQLAIGVDAMEWNLVRKWAAEGKLPVLRRLMEEGTTAELSTTAAQLPDTVWTGLFSGTNPGQSKRYYYVQYDAATMSLCHLTGDRVDAAPVWALLSEAGVRVGVADVPKYPVLQSLHGFQVANWGSHGTDVVKGSHPSGLWNEIHERFGAYPVRDCDACGDSPAALVDLRERILKGVRLHGELFRWLMANQAWDVFFAGFSGSHCIGHHFWEGTGSAIEDVYRAIDREIGETIAAAGEGVRCIIFAGHGMGPMFHATWNLTQILELLGYGKEPAKMLRPNTMRKGSVNPWRLLKMAVPGRLQYAIKRALPQAWQDRLVFRWYTGARDWKGRKAFAVPNNDSVGAIRIGVKGRDKYGSVDAGKEYKDMCRDIAEGLRELTDPRTGARVVKQVTVSHEEFSGPYLDGLPDLTVLWDQTFAWHELHSPRFGTLQVRKQDSRTGSHTPHGFAVIHGDGVARGVTLEGHSIYDITPTILKGSGVTIPAGLDGRAIL